MYIDGTYWGNFIGESDDSLTLAEYLAQKQTEELSVGEILADFGLDRLEGRFRTPDVPLVFVTAGGWEMEIHFAISLIADLAALLLECRVQGRVSLSGLLDSEPEAGPQFLRITAAPEEQRLLQDALADFAAAPLAYDLSELVPEEDLRAMATVCGALGNELSGCPDRR